MFHHHHHHRHHGERSMHHPRGGPFGRFLEERSLHGRRGRHGGGRVFDQGDLRWVILRLISEKPSHGYELIRLIEERLGGAYSPSPGVIYPTLTLLEEMGLVAVIDSDGAKKAFGITEDGTRTLADNAAQVEAIFARIAAVAERADGGPSPRILRGMENVRTALRLRLERGRLSEDQVSAIAKALDDAAHVIEAS